MKRLLKLLLASIFILTGSAFLYKYASENPDPIESVLEQNEIQEKESFALFRGYDLPNIHSEFLAGTCVVLIGASLSAGIIYFILKKMMAPK
jgi:hypothetical protein